MRTSFLPLFLLALPLLEIAGFVVVGRQIGALATVGLVLASAIAGSLLLKYQGFGVMSRIRTELEAKRDPSAQLAHGAMIVVAAFLLIVPGFISDIFGLLLFLPPVRDFAWRILKGRFTVVTSFTGGGFGGRSRTRTIDLDSDDFSRNGDAGGKPDPESPWRRLRDE